MSDQGDWSFGRKEIICVSSGSVIFALLSLVLRAAPPWWFLPKPGGARSLDKWGLYAFQGGYAEYWLQSLIGWSILGAIIGLIFSNVILRGKSWDD